MSESVNETKSLCPFLEQCDLVKMLEEKMEELSERIYNSYCTKSPSKCARYRLYDKIGASAVPPLLLPGQTDWAQQIIDELKNTVTTASGVFKR